MAKLFFLSPLVFFTTASSSELAFLPPSSSMWKIFLKAESPAD